MCFGCNRNILNNKNKKDEYELLRFVNKLNYSIIGGASKLLKYFIKTNQPTKIISYADKRWSNGNLYEKLNFKLNKISPPSFFYINNKKRETRFKYQKHKLDSLGLLNNKNISAADNMLINGYYRIYDCGTKKYELII